MQKIAIIVPCYNEESRLNSVAFLDFVRLNSNIDFWFVNDGSTDKTVTILQQLVTKHPTQLYLHSLEINKGKAEALREVFLKTGYLRQYKFIGFIDADLSTPLSEIVFFIEEMNSNSELLLAAGCRINIVGKSIVRSNLRHYLSRIFVTLYYQFLKIPNYDAQCGIKLFETNFALKLFEKPFISKWLFDIELFVRAKTFLGNTNYLKLIKEVPLHNWSEKIGSKLRITSFLVAPLEVIKIYFKYKKN